MAKKSAPKRKRKIKVDSWHGCYPSNWRGVIIKKATEHPAKFSSKLIKKIYDHIQEEGWVEAGDSVIDPFGGVGLGALEAMLAGLHWTGNELEKRFVELGMESYQCRGFTKDAWRRYQGRTAFIQRIREQRKLCPDCEDAMANPVEKRHKTSKRLLSRVIPSADPHIFRGNIPLWMSRFGALPRLGSAVLLNGDSRRLTEILKNEIRTVAMKSPPFGSVPRSSGGLLTEGYERFDGANLEDIGARVYGRETQGDTEGNLANMQLSLENFNASVSSPHKADSIRTTSEGSGIDWDLVKDGARKPSRSQEGTAIGYGEEQGQLGVMTANDEKYTAAMKSPPYANVMENRSGKDQTVPAMNGGGPIPPRVYGGSDGQLGNMATVQDSFDAAISSPPFLQSEGGTPEPKEGGAIDKRLYARHSAGNAAANGYGATDGQMSSMPASQDLFEQAISSPPYSETTITENRQFLSDENPEAPSAKNLRNAGGDAVGITPGQLGQMKSKDENLAATVAMKSPPWESNSEGVMRSSRFSRPEAYARVSITKGNPVSLEAKLAAMARDDRRAEYGSTDGNIGNDSGNDFWAAARTIIEQTYASLKPGAHACWVVKDFVKEGKIVPFCDQWRQLCESVGFTTVHEHHAELIRHRGTSYLLEGGEVRHETSAKSFFRRVLEGKGSPRIDYEVVYCMEKPR